VNESHCEAAAEDEAIRKIFMKSAVVLL